MAYGMVFSNDTRATALPEVGTYSSNWKSRLRVAQSVAQDLQLQNNETMFQLQSCLIPKANVFPTRHWLLESDSSGAETWFHYFEAADLGQLTELL